MSEIRALMLTSELFMYGLIGRLGFMLFSPEAG